ncbi:DUF2399 domain-containing protein [Xylophilus rhododendri]|uniref:DUF2399 domain-containing protein n=1 Tax=Xylophilus rhododendri TaxID=2697032 RepID=A0A857IYW4_9BURK|nr:DUF2399 domain-containing protein [Xylophilus rhododendri]QHI96774.1 DUF2399 domain-containing protein [Xylophilus rhododendri]
MAQWIDTARGRQERDRCIAAAVPQALPLLDPDHAALLRRWLRSDGARRGRAALLKEGETEAVGIERAEALCELLLNQGWIERRERLVRGAWQWMSIAWRDLPRLQALLLVSGPRQREEDRGLLIADAEAWMVSWRDTAAGHGLDPDLLDELERALAQLSADRKSRLDLLAARLELLKAVAGWHDAGEEGTRRDFALRARGATKSLSGADWRWLELAFDLERLRIRRFVQLGWLAGELELRWDGDRRMHLGALHFVGLPLDDLRRAATAGPPRRWWLIENRASFERQAQHRPEGVVLVWMPGRPSAAWMQALAHLLRQAPAPAWISADADPAGVDIACSVGALWHSSGLDWEPHQMGVAQWEATSQRWPLNAHDRRLLAELLARPDLADSLRALCEAMQREGRKAEQEAWI